jgi:hypothetical protein
MNICDSKSSWKTETQREQLRACTEIPNLAKPKYRALLVGDNSINKIRFKSTGSCCVINVHVVSLLSYILPISCSDAEISETSATVMLDFWWARSGVDVNAAHAVLSEWDNGTLVAKAVERLRHRENN